MKHKIYLILAVFIFSPIAAAKLNVLTSITDLKYIVQEVGGAMITVDSIAKGTQDPHFVEAKPSFMTKANKADLLITIGLEMEGGWIPNIVRGARNPKVNEGAAGRLEVGPLVQPIEVMSGQVTRAMGDVHPEGNPHVTLDPLRAATIARIIGKRLGELDPENAAAYTANAGKFETRLKEKTVKWQERLLNANVKEVVTYHKTLNYFLDRFGIQAAMMLEPRPGIPPTSGHVMEVIRAIKDKKIPLILVENFFDPVVTKKVKDQAPAVRVEIVPVSVGGATGINSLDDLYEKLVTVVEGK